MEQYYSTFLVKINSLGEKMIIAVIVIFALILACCVLVGLSMLLGGTDDESEDT